MTVYEIRAQAVAPEECVAGELWHVVESDRLRALCGSAVGAQKSARPLSALAEIDHECCCEPCEKIHRATASRVLDDERRDSQVGTPAGPTSHRVDIYGVEAGPGQPVGRPVEVDGSLIGVAVSHFDLMRLLGNHGISSTGDAVWHGGDPTDWPGGLSGE